MTSTRRVKTYMSSYVALDADALRLLLQIFCDSSMKETI
jgi:hypothetical protein